MCSREGCDVAPEWRPVLIVRAGTVDVAKSMRCVIGLGLCGMCKAKTKLADFLTDKFWASISDRLVDAGAPKPIRALTTLDFCGINSKESRALVTHRGS